VDDHHTSRRQQGVRSTADEAGLTLVEMLLAMVILGIIFAGTAGALISFTQASVNNERRVQSTATLNRLHEELQALPWEDAVLYANEVAALPALDGLTLGPSPTFDGEPIVLIDGPDCDVADPDCRITTVPEPYEDPLTPAPSDGRDYEVYRLVTWVDRDGAAPESLKRFTTVVRWQAYGRTIEQRFDSERAPTPAETSEGNPSIQFLVTPSEVQLAADGTNEQAIQINADFSLLGPVTSAEVGFEAPAGTPRTFTLTQVPATGRFDGTIAVGQFAFPEGSQEFVLTGTGGASVYTTTATVSFEPHDPSLIGGGEDPPTITQVSLVDAPSDRTVGRVPPNNDRLCSRVRVEVRLDQYVPPDPAAPAAPYTTVTANYNGSSGPQSVSLQHVAGNRWAHEFPQGAASPWRPTAGNPVKDTFKVVAQNPDSGPSTVEESSELTFNYSTKPSGQC
jgi:prepilin-type N-terminal cleavage/methylation domain-containing protein